MLHDNNILIRFAYHFSDHASCIKPLFDVQVRTWFVEHVNIDHLHTGQSNDEPLELSTRKLSNLTLQYIPQIQLFNGLVVQSLLVKVTKPPPHNSLTHVLLFCYRIDILDLDKCFHVVLEHSSKECLKF